MHEKHGTNSPALWSFQFQRFSSVPVWSSSAGDKADNTAFLFSLTKPSNTPLKLKVKTSHYPVCHFSNYGLTFGACHDLFVSSLSNINSESYMLLYIHMNFQMGMKVANSSLEALITDSKLLK